MKRYLFTLALSALSLQTNAATYVFEAGGEIDFVPAWAAFVEVGDSWSASLSIDSNVTDSSPHPDPAWYPYLEGSISFGDYTYEIGTDFTYAEGQQITLSDNSTSNPPRDAVWFFLYAWPSYPEIDGYALNGAFFYLGAPASLWDSNALSVLEEAEYADFDFTQFTLQFNNTNGDITGTVDRYTMSVVPVPAAFWLLGSALGLVGWMRRKGT